MVGFLVENWPAVDMVVLCRRVVLATLVRV